MRINIKGNDITPDKIAGALAACEREYGLKIKGATIYVRFERDDGSGQTVEPLYNGEEISRDFVFRKATQPVRRQAPKTPEPSEPPLPSSEIVKICERAAHRMLSAVEIQALAETRKMVPITRPKLEWALGILKKQHGKFDVHMLNRILTMR